MTRTGKETRRNGRGMAGNEARSGLTVSRVFLLLLAMLAAALSGCGGPRSKIRTPRGAEISQKGETQAPARVNTTETRTETTLPAGSSVTIEPSGAVRVDVTAAAPLAAVVSREEATGPQSFAPPSPAELAKGWNAKLWGAAGLGLALLALVLALRSHFKAAAVAGVGAVLVPIVGHFVNSTAGMIAAGIFAAVAISLFVAWHLMRARGLVTAGHFDTPAKSQAE